MKLLVSESGVWRTREPILLEEMNCRSGVCFVGNQACKLRTSLRTWGGCVFRVLNGLASTWKTSEVVVSHTRNGNL